MQIAATNPSCVRREEIAPEVLEHERDILRAQALNEGKPANIIEKMITGRVEKYYKEACLMEQTFIKNPDQTITQLINETISKIGENVSIRRFARYQLGEGMEKKANDFAAEVMAAAKK